MAFKDLREYLARLEEVGELQRISGAHWDLEMGVISELSYENQGPALLFEEIPGYSPEYKVVSNLCSTERRSFLAPGGGTPAGQWGRRCVIGRRSTRVTGRCRR